MTTLDDIGDRLDEVAQELAQLDADLALISAGDRPAGLRKKDPACNI